MTSCHREQEEAFAKGELRRKRNSCGVEEVMAVPTLNLMCHFSRTRSLFFFTALTVALASERLGYERGQFFGGC